MAGQLGSVGDAFPWTKVPLNRSTTRQLVGNCPKASGVVPAGEVAGKITAMVGGP